MSPSKFQSFRKKLKLSRKQMASAIGFKSERIVYMYENGERKVSGTVALLCKYISKFGLIDGDK